MPQNRPKFRTIAISLLILSAVAFLAVSVINRIPSYNITQSKQLPSGFASAIAYGDNSLLYSNGQSLMTYDVGTTKSAPLSPAVGLSGSQIDSLSISTNKKFVLFHDGLVARNGTLSQQLQSQGLDPTQDYWWVYSTADQSFKNLPQTIALAKITGDTIEALSGTGGNEAIIYYNAQTLASQRQVNVPGSTDFLATGNGLILQTPSNQLLTTNDGVVNQVIASNATTVGLTNDGQLIAVIGPQAARKLVIMNLSSNSQKIIATKIISQPVVSNDNILYVTGSGKAVTQSLYSYNLTTHKKQLWKFTAGSAQISNAALSPVVITANGSMLVNSGAQSYLIRAD